MEKYTVKSRSPEETEKAGASLAEKLLSENPGELCFVLLEGDVGAGKTAFCRGFSSVISPKSRVKSPSYTIVNEYRRGGVPLFHFDLYRLGEDADISDIGFFEYVKTGHVIIEWSEYLDRTFLPENAVRVHIQKDGETERTITVSKTQKRSGT